MKDKIELDGNVYFVRGNAQNGYEVTKSHNGGEKKVGNSDRIKQVLELAQAE